MLAVVSDILLIEFLEKRNKEVLLLDKSEQISLKNYFPNYTFALSLSDYNSEINRLPKELFGDFLKLANGKISLYGECLHHIMKHGFVYLTNYQMAFCNCTELERDNLLNELIRIANETGTSRSFITKDVHQIIVCIWEHFFIYIPIKIFNNEEQLLENIKLKHSWNPIRGYLCSVTTSIKILIDIRDTPVKPSDINDPIYKPDFVGISYDRYSMLAKLQYMFDVPNDIFRILCNLWLIVMVYDARDRLVEYS